MDSISQYRSYAVLKITIHEILVTSLLSDIYLKLSFHFRFSLPLLLLYNQMYSDTNGEDRLKSAAVWWFLEPSIKRKNVLLEHVENELRSTLESLEKE